MARSDAARHRQSNHALRERKAYNNKITTKAKAIKAKPTKPTKTNQVNICQPAIVFPVSDNRLSRLLTAPTAMGTGVRGIGWGHRALGGTQNESVYTSTAISHLGFSYFFIYTFGWCAPSFAKQINASTSNHNAVRDAEREQHKFNKRQLQELALLWHALAEARYESAKRDTLDAFARVPSISLH